MEMPVRLQGSQRTKPAIQVPNMIQQTIQGGLLTHQSRQVSSRRQIRDTEVASRNPKYNLAQTNLEGENLKEKDNEAFSNNFLSQPGSNCSIITFQNTSQILHHILQSKSLKIAKASKSSNASVVLYAKNSLNEIQIYATKRFHQRIVNANPKSISESALMSKLTKTLCDATLGVLHLQWTSPPKNSCYHQGQTQQASDNGHGLSQMAGKNSLPLKYLSIAHVSTNLDHQQLGTNMCNISQIRDF